MTGERRVGNGEIISKLAQMETHMNYVREKITELDSKVDCLTNSEHERRGALRTIKWAAGIGGGGGFVTGILALIKSFSHGS